MPLALRRGIRRLFMTLFRIKKFTSSWWREIHAWSCCSCSDFIKHFFVENSLRLFYIMAMQQNGAADLHKHSASNNSVTTNGIEEVEYQQTGRFTFSAEPSLEDIRRMQAEFTDERNWNQFHQPRNLLLALVGEVGEVSELFQWRGEVAEGLPDWTEPEREHLAQELSDVLIYLVELAEKCNVDLPQAVLRKLALNKLKYPANKVHGSAKKYTEYKD